MNEPTIVTIPKVSDAIPDVGQLKVGDELEIQAKVTAIDEQGVSIQVVRAAKATRRCSPETKIPRLISLPARKRRWPARSSSAQRTYARQPQGS